MYWVATSIGTQGSGQILLLLQNFYYPWAQNINPILDLIPCLSSTCFDSNPSSSDVLSWLILPLLPPCLGPCLPAVKVVAFVGCMDILPAPCQVSRHCLDSCFSPSVSVPPIGVYVRQVCRSLPPTPSGFLAPDVYGTVLSSGSPQTNSPST